MQYKAFNLWNPVDRGRIHLVQYVTLCPKAREKESFAEAYPPRLLLHHIALSGEHAGKPQQREGTEEEGGRRLFLSPPNHFTHPRFSNCLTRSLTPPPLSRSVGRSPSSIHPSILRPFAPRQFRCAAGRSIGPFLHRCESGLPASNSNWSDPYFQTMAFKWLNLTGTTLLVKAA